MNPKKNKKNKTTKAKGKNKTKKDGENISTCIGPNRMMDSRSSLSLSSQHRHQPSQHQREGEQPPLLLRRSKSFGSSKKLLSSLAKKPLLACGRKQSWSENTFSASRKNANPANNGNKPGRTAPEARQQQQELPPGTIHSFVFDDISSSASVSSASVSVSSSSSLQGGRLSGGSSTNYTATEESSCTSYQREQDQEQDQEQEQEQERVFSSFMTTTIATTRAEAEAEADADASVRTHTMSTESDTHTDCPICLETMHPYDISHPLQCSTKVCSYNFCADCIESLIRSSKDGYQMSSDGNQHVKVFLHCPNCRADLSDSLRDTLLLRKTDAVNQQQLNHNDNDNDDDNDDESIQLQHRLTEKQLKWKQAMEEDPTVQTAIQKARIDEQCFFQNKHNQNRQTAAATTTTTTPSGVKRDPISAEEGHRHSSIESIFSMEEWGFEMDLINGVHDSFHIPSIYRRTSSSMFSDEDEDEDDYYDEDEDENDDYYNDTHNKKKNRNHRHHHHHNNNRRRGPRSGSAPIDATLLRGLEVFLQPSEQRQLCQFLTSGDPDQLAHAAKWFQDIMENPPSIHNNDNDHNNNGKGREQQLLRRSGQRRNNESDSVDDDDDDDDDDKRIDYKSKNPKQLKKLSSIFELIEESEKQHQRKQKQKQKQKQDVVATTRILTTHQRATQSRREVMEEARRRAALLQQFPLPVRMPKYYAQLNLNEIEFVESTWDGTVVDAYNNKLHLQQPSLPQPTATATTKTTAASSLLSSTAMSAKKTTSSQQTYNNGGGGARKTSMIPPTTLVPHTSHNKGVRNILGDTEVRIAMPGTKRLVVQSVSFNAGQMGIVKGDVLTHMDGGKKGQQKIKKKNKYNSGSSRKKKLQPNNSSPSRRHQGGTSSTTTTPTTRHNLISSSSSAAAHECSSSTIEDMSLHDLQTQWKAYQELGETTMPAVVFNAERSVAEALKRRAFAIQEQQQNLSR